MVYNIANIFWEKEKFGIGNCYKESKIETVNMNVYSSVAYRLNKTEGWDGVLVNITYKDWIKQKQSIR